MEMSRSIGTDGPDSDSSLDKRDEYTCAHLHQLSITRLVQKQLIVPVGVSTQTGRVAYLLSSMRSSIYDVAPMPIRTV